MFLSSILPVSMALPAPFYEGVTPFLVLGAVRLNAPVSVGSTQRQPPVFKMENVSEVLRTSQSQIFLQFCLKGPHQGFVLFSPRKLVACPLPLSAVGMAFVMPFLNRCPKCSPPPFPCWVFWDTEASVWGPNFPFSGRSCEQPRCLRPHFGLMGQDELARGPGLLCATSVAGRGRRGAP